MLFNFFQNTIAVIRQWFETIQLIAKPAPVPVRIRVDRTEHMQRLGTRRQAALYSKYRR